MELYERGNHDSWFWMGEQIGKWLDAAAYSAVIAGDKELEDKVHEVLGRLKASQREDGWLSISRRANPVRGMQLYEWYYLLHGLIVCYEILHSEAALSIASRMTDYIIETWGVEPGQFPLAGAFPGNGHGGGEGTLILEPVVILGILTQNAKYIEWGKETLQKWDEWLDKFPESTHTCGYTPMRKIAAGEMEVFEAREPIHAHTFHMTLLGLAALYDATGESEYLDTVLGCIDHIADRWIFITGGMSSNERYVPRRFYNPRNDVEVCPQHTWILLLEKALNWTGRARYSAEMERALFNSFLAAQLADGSNWSYLTPMNGTAQNPGSPNCCNAAGMRIAARMPTYLYGTTESGIAALIYTESSAKFRAPDGTEVSVYQKTDYSTEGKIELSIESERDTCFEMRLIVPEHAESFHVTIGEEMTEYTPGDSYVNLERTWKSGDRIMIDMLMKLQAVSNQRRIAIMRGPLVYTYFQDTQEDPVIFHKRRGLYPDDIALLIDPEKPEASLDLVEAENRLLGPGLKIPGRINRVPVFTAEAANMELDDPEEMDLLLLPFVNQGAVRGPYRIFMDYERL